MKFLKKGFEYNKAAKAFNSVFVMLNEYEVKFNSGLRNDYFEFEKELMILAYVCRRDIIDRMEEYGWAMASPISVPMISRGRITLMFAYQQTIGRLLKYAGLINLSDEVQKILDKGSAYYEIDNIIPGQMKSKP